MKVLTIGNSFSEVMTALLPPVAKSTGVEIEVEDLTIGGCTMERHWGNIVREAEEPGYHYFEEGTYKAKLVSKTWDFVTIQQASHESWRLASYRPYAKQLFDFIKKNAPTAEVLLQMTWAWREDDTRYQTLKLETQENMFKNILSSYETIAAELGLRVIPTGIAIETARNTQPNPYIPFNPADYTYPDLPDVSNSFNNAVWWNEDHTAIVGDPAHLNPRGDFLQACVWFGTLTGKSIKDITYQPEGVSAEDADFLKQTAQAVLDIYRQPRERNGRQAPID